MFCGVRHHSRDAHVVIQLAAEDSSAAHSATVDPAAVVVSVVHVWHSFQYKIDAVQMNSTASFVARSSTRSILASIAARLRKVMSERSHLVQTRYSSTAYFLDLRLPHDSSSMRACCVTCGKFLAW